MKKLFLIAVLVAFAGVAQAQQVVVKTPDALSGSAQLDAAKAPKVTFEQKLLMLTEQARNNRVRSTTNTLRKTQTNDLYEIGLMANTYAMIGDTRNQIACDPNTGNVAVIFRGNDRSSQGDGNTLYIRYSNDNGATWTPQGDNIANSASPRYPSIFLPNANGSSGAHTAVLWPQVTTFGDGTDGFGEVYSMKADIGNGNPSYGQFATPPNWSIPWQIKQDQATGDLYSIALALEPSNGTSTGEYFVMKSTDGGANWNPVNFDNPVWYADLTPSGYFTTNVRFDISPNGTMICAYNLIIESEPGSALLLEANHEIAYRISTDMGSTWSDPERIKPSALPNLPRPFDAKCEMSWDLDVILDKDDMPHFITVLSADLYPFWPTNEAPTDSTISLVHVDSTFTSEICMVPEGGWKVYPIGPVRRVRTDRLSFTATSSTDAAAVFRNEPNWARNWDGSKIYAKWISPIFTWFPVVDQTLPADTICQIYVNGRNVDSRSLDAWTYKWNYTDPDDPNTFVLDSIMRVTDLEDVMAKYTKIAYYANEQGEDGHLHIIFTEWGIGERLDDDPVFTDQVVWYVNDVMLKVLDAVDVEQLDATPGAFALAQNYPNPFNPSTEISFTLPKASQVSLRIFNLLGQEVATLVDEYRNAGTHRVTFDASKLSSGMYIYRLESGANSVAKKMMLSK
ncbi:T9SS type A sorting domain-containing protein [bacterium]|nr:T9SS type A sorting domain-containing protein [bacterium]